jgi:hypothetical protein
LVRVGAILSTIVGAGLIAYGLLKAVDSLQYAYYARPTGFDRQMATGLATAVFLGLAVFGGVMAAGGLSLLRRRRQGLRALAYACGVLAALWFAAGILTVIDYYTFRSSVSSLRQWLWDGLAALLLGALLTALTVVFARGAKTTPDALAGPDPL